MGPLLANLFPSEMRRSLKGGSYQHVQMLFNNFTSYTGTHVMVYLFYIDLDVWSIKTTRGLVHLSHIDASILLKVSFLNGLTQKTSLQQP